MSKLFIPFWIILIIWAVVGILLAVKAGYVVHRETGAWLNRAQVSSSAEDMDNYLEKLETGMEEFELTDGNAAFVFKTPDNDMELIMKAIEKARVRLGEIKQMSIASVEYQTGLDDVRGVLRELEPQAEYRYCINHWFWFWFSALFGWILVIVLCVVGFVYYD